MLRSSSNQAILAAQTPVSDIRSEASYSTAPTRSLHLFDADGCLYNYDYHLRLRTLTRDFFKEFNLAINDSELREANLTSIITAYKNEWAAAFSLVSQLNRQEKLLMLSDCVVSLGELIEENDDDSIVAFDIQAETRRYMNHCIKLLYEFDKNFMLLLLVDSNPAVNAALSEDDNIKGVAIFSARQSRLFDQKGSNDNQTGLIHIDIGLLSEKFDCHYASLTTTDIIHGLADGSTVSLSQNNLPDNHACQDEYRKALFVYVHAHAQSAKYPQEVNIIKIYDDLDEIIVAIIKIYSAHPELLPWNVVLEVNQYAGEGITKTMIQGLGRVDSCYRHHAKVIFELIKLKVNKIRRDNTLIWGDQPRVNFFERDGIPVSVHYFDMIELFKNDEMIREFLYHRDKKLDELESTYNILSSAFSSADQKSDAQIKQHKIMQDNYHRSVAKTAAAEIYADYLQGLAESQQVNPINGEMLDSTQSSGVSFSRTHSSLTSMPGKLFSQSIKSPDLEKEALVDISAEEAEPSREFPELDRKRKIAMRY